MLSFNFNVFVLYARLGVGTSLLTPEKLGRYHDFFSGRARTKVGQANLQSWEAETAFLYAVTIVNTEHIGKGGGLNSLLGCYCPHDLVLCVAPVRKV